MIYELEVHISWCVYSLSDDDNVRVITILLGPPDLSDISDISDTTSSNIKMLADVTTDEQKHLIRHHLSQAWTRLVEGGIVGRSENRYSILGIGDCEDCVRVFGLRMN